MFVNNNIIGLDIGTKRIGVAIFYFDKKVINGLCMIEYKKHDFEYVLLKLAPIIKAFNICKAIIGSPKDYISSNSYIVTYIERFIASFKNYFSNIECNSFSEHNSTQEALNILKIQNLKSDLKDIESAKIILQNYLKKCRIL